jgi:hypothetical protein
MAADDFLGYYWYIEGLNVDFTWYGEAYGRL